LLDNVQLRGDRGRGAVRQRSNGRGQPGATDALGPARIPRAPVQPPTDLQIDLTEIRRALYREIVPRGRAEALTPDERQRVAREINQRMLGIVQGIKLSAAELQKNADDARKQAAAEANAVDSAPASSAVLPVKRTAALSGSHLDVTIERDGEVIRTASADIDLPNVLLTVFSTAPRERGEIPFAVDKAGKVYAPTDEDRSQVEALGSVARPDGPLGKTVLPEWIIVSTPDSSGSGLRFGMAQPVGDSLAELRNTARRNALFGLLIIGLALVGVAPLATRLTRNLSELTDGVTRIAHGDYSVRVAVKSRDEIGTLAQAFNQMAEDVERHQRAVVEQERVKRELELGRQIQHDMLPRLPFQSGQTEIKGASLPAREVGGDFFNYFALPGGHIAMLVGDVSGKGVGAALLMANIQGSLRTRFALGQDLAAVVDAIDRDIEANSPGNLYATLFVGVLDPVTRRFRYVNAGHHPQFIMRRLGGLERMESTHLPVGLLAGRGYRQREVQLQEGDRLFFYTDGCVEAKNEADEMFGAERLETLLASVGASSPDDMLRRVEKAVEQFRGSRELFDDLTLMAARVG
jgi:serine phosphatase RsbU (regulator of sigma subunit)